jgi:hypothetical protein
VLLQRLSMSLDFYFTFPTGILNRVSFPFDQVFKVCYPSGLLSDSLINYSKKRPLARGFHGFGSQRKEFLHRKTTIHEILIAEKTRPQLIVRGHIREKSRKESNSLWPFQVSGIVESRELTSGIAKS